MGIALRDQSGNLRRSEDLLGDVAGAFARIEDPAERVRLAFKLFDSRAWRWSTCSAAAAMRSRRCAIGLAISASSWTSTWCRDAERARTELDTLSQVISANLTRAALEAAPAIADLSSWLADVAGKAGIAWERLFVRPRRRASARSATSSILPARRSRSWRGRSRSCRESPTLGFTTFLDTAQISALERKLDELRRARDQTQARIAFLEGPPDTGSPGPASSASA